MAFEQSITLPSQHDISYWRIIDADINFIDETAQFTFGGYIDRQHRLQFENNPAKTHNLRVPSQAYKEQIPHYGTALPAAITTQILVFDEDAPFSGANTTSRMTWNYDTIYNGFPVSHFRIRRLRMNWNRKFAQLSFNAYKDEATFDPDNPNQNTTQVGSDLQRYRFSVTQFNDYFAASRVGGTETVENEETGETTTLVDPLEGKLGFDRSTVYAYAKAHDPFFENATDVQKEETTNTSGGSDPTQPSS